MIYFCRFSRQPNGRVRIFSRLPGALCVLLPYCVDFYLIFCFGLSLESGGVFGWSSLRDLSAAKSNSESVVSTKSANRREEKRRKDVAKMANGLGYMRSHVIKNLKCMMGDESVSI